MPTYDFKCLKCNKIFEQFCKISDMSSIVCPACKGATTKYFASTPVFYFKDKYGHTTTPVHIPDDIAHATEDELDRDLGLA